MDMNTWAMLRSISRGLTAKVNKCSRIGSSPADLRRDSQPVSNAFRTTLFEHEGIEINRVNI